MKNKYFAFLFLLFANYSFAQNQLQGYDPFPLLGGTNDNIYNIAFDSQNRPWVGEGYVNAVPREIAYFNGNAWTTIAAPSAIYNSFREIEFDTNNVLWMGGGAFLVTMIMVPGSYMMEMLLDCRLLHLICLTFLAFPFLQVMT